MELTYKHEKPLFRIALTLAVLFWIVLILGTFGIALLYILLAYIVFLFTHSYFISHLKGTGVKITPEQYPDLHDRLAACCERVGVAEIPEAYILRTDFFNALATRFLGRNFVVLFSDVVDALADRPDAVDFYFGHELGHIHRKHLLWNPILLPASVLPVLGTALKRAEEYTCDRYGVACCGSAQDVQSALAAIAAGDTRWKSLSSAAYTQQVSVTSGFWMSFHELTGDYPWLTKRMSTALALTKGEELKHPRRHWFAWFLSLFIPRFGAGGAASLLMTLVLIGVIAAVAIPKYHAYQLKAKVAVTYHDALQVQEKVTRYAMANKAWPASMQDLDYPKEWLPGSAADVEIGLYDDGIIGAKVGVTSEGKGKYLVLEPAIVNGELKWSCYGQELSEDVLPEECR